MSQTPEKKPAAGKPNEKSAPVFTYLAIMFAAAFLMLLLAYFIQQRNNDVAIDGLKDSITSSFASMDEVLEENRQLREEMEALEEELESLNGEKHALETELDTLTAAYAQLEKEFSREQDTSSAAHDSLSSWSDYWAIEQLYQAKQYEKCANAIKALQHSTYYTTPEAAQSQANEIWDTLADKGLLTEEDAFANLFRSVPPQP